MSETRTDIFKGERRIKYVAMHADLLRPMISGNGESVHVSIYSEIPEDAIGTGFHYDVMTNSFNLFFEHESFEPVPLNQHPPHADVMICKHYDAPALEWHSMESGERPDLISNVLVQEVNGIHHVARWREDESMFEDDESFLPTIVAWAYIPPWNGK